MRQCEQSVVASTWSEMIVTSREPFLSLKTTRRLSCCHFTGDRLEAGHAARL